MNKGLLIIICRSRHQILKETSTILDLLPTSQDIKAMKNGVQHWVHRSKRGQEIVNMPDNVERRRPTLQRLVRRRVVRAKYPMPCRRNEEFAQFWQHDSLGRIEGDLRQANEMLIMLNLCDVLQA